MPQTSPAETEAVLKEFILTEFLPGEDPDALTVTTPLITTSILDSIATLRLVTFLEERFGIQLEAHEIDVEQLNTVATIARLVGVKQAASSK
jgi:acyl carrier protein